MSEKVNIAELLEDCPKGMELYSPIFGKVYLDKVRPHLGIVVTTDKYKEEFLYDSRYGMNGECMLFPSKEKTTWEGFQRPFMDGDVVATTNGLWIGITTGGEKGKFIPTYCVIRSGDEFEFKAYPDRKGEWAFNRLATEEEKKKLFNAIKENGYRWNPETKTLEKLPKFKVGDKIKYKNGKNIDGVEQGVILSITDEVYDVAVTNNMGVYVSIAEQDDWELVLDKFDINNLKPLQPVLVRDTNGQVWTMDLFSHKIDTNKRLRISFVCVGHYPNQCIPYEGNEHLLGTVNDCDDFYKTWE